MSQYAVLAHGFVLRGPVAIEAMHICKFRLAGWLGLLLCKQRMLLSCSC